MPILIMLDQKKEQIVENLMKYIRNMNTGDRASTGYLYSQHCGDVTVDEIFDLMDIDLMLMDVAATEGIILDKSHHFGKFVGLPQNLDFVVRKW